MNERKRTVQRQEKKRKEREKGEEIDVYRLIVRLQTFTHYSTHKKINMFDSNISQFISKRQHKRRNDHQT
jgi:hypothetical protein